MRKLLNFSSDAAIGKNYKTIFVILFGIYGLTCFVVGYQISSFNNDIYNILLSRMLDYYHSSFLRILGEFMAKL